MRKVGILCSGVVGLMFAASTAAADRTMVVLLDATGSMQTTRCDNGLSRFDQSKLDAADRVSQVAGETGGLSGGVAVFKFSGSGTGIVPVTAGFVSPFDAVTAIGTATVTSDLTPLANAMCSVIDTARSSGSGATTTTRFLEVFSDGGENNSIGAPCAGPFSVSNSPPFDSGPPASWQNLVYDRTTNPLPEVTVDATLYHNETGCPLFAVGIDPEAAALAALGRQAPALSAPATDVDFFSALATATGGTFTDVVDSAPVPVFADLDGNFVIDRNDAIILARQFGAPATDAFDLNGDGKIGFADYQMLLKRLGSGSGTPEPDPYTPSPPITCHDAQTIRIEGKVIENSGLTIHGTGSCHVIIAKSLIVSGTAAITVRGTAVLDVDDSIIVGEGDWLRSRGSVLLSAAGSVFHGTQTVSGAFTYTDRGGNTFE